MDIPVRRQTEMANQQQQQAVASERTRERESSRQQEADNKETSTVDKWLQGVAKRGLGGKKKNKFSRFTFPQLLGVATHRILQYKNIPGPEEKLQHSVEPAFI